MSSANNIMPSSYTSIIIKKIIINKVLHIVKLLNTLKNKNFLVFCYSLTVKKMLIVKYINKIIVTALLMQLFSW